MAKKLINLKYMKTKLLSLFLLTSLFGVAYAQNDKNANTKKEKNVKQQSQKTETVILPDGTESVVPKPAESRNDAVRNQRRQPGKMEAVEVKEVKPNEPK